MRYNIRAPALTAMFAALALAVTAFFMATPTDALALAPNGTDQVITTAPMTHDPPGTELVTLAATMADNTISQIDIDRTVLSSGAESLGTATIVRQTLSTATTNYLAVNVAYLSHLFAASQAVAAADNAFPNRTETGRGDAPVIVNVATIGDNLVNFGTLFVNTATADNTDNTLTARRSVLAAENVNDHGNYPNPFN